MATATSLSAAEAHIAPYDEALQEMIAKYDAEQLMKQEAESAKMKEKMEGQEAEI